MNITGHDILPHGSHVKALVLFLLFWCSTLHAQRSTMRFDRITSEQGLSDNYVLSALQDRYGFMWFGTRDGLNRYDGYRFTVYRHQPGISESLSDGSVNCIFEDREGTLWVGTHSGGVNRFNRERGRFMHYRHEPGNPGTIAWGEVSTMCEDDNGDIWIGAAGPGAGISRFDRKRNTFVRYHHDSSDINSLSSDYVTCVARDKAGIIWIGTEDGGLNRFDFATGRFINHHHDPQLSHAVTGPIRKLYGAADGTLWIRAGNDLRILHAHRDGAAGSGITPPLEAVHRDISIPNLVHHDRSGRIWIGTFLDGIYVAPGNSGERQHAYFNPTDKNSISSNKIFCIHEDRSGNIWIGTDRGINKLSRGNWNFEYYHYNPLGDNSLSHWVVRSIKRDRSGTLWIGTGGGGLDRVDSETGHIIHYANDPKMPGSISDNTVNEIYEDRRGRIWVGTNAGLNLFNKKTGRFTRYISRRNDPTTLPHGGIWEILEDDAGNFRVGTLGGGVGILDTATGTFQRYIHNHEGSSSPGRNSVLCIYEDSRKNLFTGTDNGLDFLEKSTGRLTHFTHNEDDPNSLSNNRVWYIHEDRNGILWIATSGGGLNRFDPATRTFRAYTEEHGLVNNTVCAILEDLHGRLWISTNKGLSRFDPATDSFRNYTARDGLYISEFHFKACHADADGFLYFGGTDGIIRFHPDSIDEKSSAPPLALTSFQVFDTEYALDTCISLKRIIRLPHDSSFFSIGFAALDFTNPLRTRYRYKLEGFDDGWRETDGTDSRAHYTAITAGSYIFRVESSGTDGIWKPSGTSLVIIIDPAFWQTWWFRGLSVITLLSIVFVIGYIRIRNAHHEAELKRRLVDYKLQALRAQMNPHFIFNSLNSILHFIVHHDPDAAHVYLSKFSKLIRMTLEHSKNESITLADEIEALRFYVDLESIRFEDQFSYQIHIADDIDLKTIRIPPMLIQPHVENAIKHGLTHRETGGQLLIDVREHGPWIVCSVEDNGIGRDQSAQMKVVAESNHQPRGIEITRERLDVFTSLNGGNYECDIEDIFDESGMVAGTRVEIRIPKRM